MAPPRGSSSGSAERRFFLTGPVTPEAPVRLLPEDEQHALRVLRLEAGDRLWGLDGVGSCWPLAVRATGRSLEVEIAGEPEVDARPGSEGAAPRLVVACALPRPNRQPSFVDRLTQLGLSSFRPLLFERSATRELPENRIEKLRRSAREACKQSGRLWLPEFAPPREWNGLRELLGETDAAVLLDAGADRSLVRLGDSLDRPTRSVTVIAGPEGGITSSERAAILEAGGAAASLGRGILRIETAVEAALATLDQVL